MKKCSHPSQNNLSNITYHQINLNQTSSFPSSPPQWIAIPSNTEDRQAQRAPKARPLGGAAQLMANSSFHTTPRWTWHEVSPNLVVPRWGSNRPVGYVWVGGTHAVQKAGKRDSKTQTMVNRQCWRGLWWNILF